MKEQEARAAEEAKAAQELQDAESSSEEESQVVNEGAFSKAMEGLPWVADAEKNELTSKQTRNREAKLLHRKKWAELPENSNCFLDGKEFENISVVTRAVLEAANLSVLQRRCFARIWRFCLQEERMAASFENLVLLFSQVLAPHSLARYRDVALHILTRREFYNQDQQNRVVASDFKPEAVELWKGMGAIESHERMHLDAYARGLVELHASFRNIRIASWQHRLAAANYYDKYLLVKKNTSKSDEQLDVHLNQVLETALENGRVKNAQDFRRYARTMHQLRDIFGENFYFLFPDTFLFSPPVAAVIDREYSGKKVFFKDMDTL